MEQGTMLDDVVTGVLVDVIYATGRQLGIGLLNRRGRSHKDDIELARWFDTYRLTGEAPELPGLPSDVSIEELAEVLNGDEFQSVLHELLAARLSSAPQTDAARVGASLELILAAAFPGSGLSAFASALFAYYDDRICQLVDRLKRVRPDLLDKIRQEALAVRSIAVLHAIERHAAALAGRAEPQVDTEFMARYRRHVVDYHGKLEPPDLERRRRVAIAELYVDPAIVQLKDAELAELPRLLDLWTFARELDRTVLLGDPGGGKTSAAHVLMDFFSRAPGGRIPFMVILREFAAEDPPARSIVGHIEHKLEAFYQCAPPRGLLERLLLSGTAIVIFDGLDELVDTARRIDVTAVIEQFSAEYPLARILVTSRLVGYDEARLDDRLFGRYRISGFDEERASRYAAKWFAQEDGVQTPEAARWAQAFMAESAEVADLRSNPLMLALMCILYRGEGSIPRNRPEVYEQCSRLLFLKWDARRRIDIELRARHLIEPTLRHLAFWLFTRSQTQNAVTERELIAETTRFFHGRGFESEEQAEEAAREFVSFCRGRAWVFSDVGTTASGQVLYTFTHRTFLEYFAAAFLTSTCDTPEALARAIVPRVARQQWEVVADVATQIKDRTSDRGGERIINSMLADRENRSVSGRSHVLGFLAHSLRFIDPSPRTVRDLSRSILDHVFDGNPDNRIRCNPLHQLVTGCAGSREIIAGEITERADALIGHSDLESLVKGLRLAACVDDRNIEAQNDRIGSYSGELWKFWNVLADRNASRYMDTIVTTAAQDVAIKYMALIRGLITEDQVLAEHHPDLGFMFREQLTFFGIAGPPYMLRLLYDLINGRTWYRGRDAVTGLRSFGSYAMRQSDPPFVKDATSYGNFTAGVNNQNTSFPHLDVPSYIGAALALGIEMEAGYDTAQQKQSRRSLGPLDDLNPYIIMRLGEPAEPLPVLPLPDHFKELFYLWAHGQVNFVSHSILYVSAGRWNGRVEGPPSQGCAEWHRTPADGRLAVQLLPRAIASRTTRVDRVYRPHANMKTNSPRTMRSLADYLKHVLLFVQKKNLKFVPHTDNGLMQPGHENKDGLRRTIQSSSLIILASSKPPHRVRVRSRDIQDGRTFAETSWMSSSGPIA
jgi:hypothetical protein